MVVNTWGSPGLFTTTEDASPALTNKALSRFLDPVLEQIQRKPTLTRSRA